jgi:two-component system sensor histidine kinase BaeS
VWILALPAVVAVAAVPVLRRWVTQRRSVAGAALAVGLCSLAIGAISSTAASNAMFLTGHDFRLFLVMAVLSAGIALLVGYQLSRPLADDVRRLGQVATAVADGDLTARTGIRRRDEVGATAAAVDRMVAQLAAAETERAQLTQARHDLLSGVGHDLRTPLAAMRSAVESLQDGLAPDPDRYLAVVANQIDTVSGLIDQLFLYARLESGDRPTDVSRVSISELADEAAEALAPLADQRHVKIDLQAESAAFVHGSPSGLSRVFRNLLDNAVRHAPADSVVRLAVSTPGDHVDVRVLDTGAGFPDDFKPRAFDPFTRADPARNADGSAGLGLAITKAIVDAHGGTITLGDGPGGDVRVRLPTSLGA